MSIEIIDINKDFMCCGKRLELMPYSGIWALGCYSCEMWTDNGVTMDESVFIIDSLHEIGSN